MLITDKFQKLLLNGPQGYVQDHHENVPDIAPASDEVSSSVKRAILQANLLAEMAALIPVTTSTDFNTYCHE